MIFLSASCFWNSSYVKHVLNDVGMLLEEKEFHFVIAEHNNNFNKNDQGCFK